jgi:lysophospholipase L1-like esterase
MKKKLVFMLLLVAVFSTAQSEKSSKATIPNGAQPATQNMVYWTSGSVTFYDVDGNQLVSDPSGYAVSPAKAAWVVTTSDYWEFPAFKPENVPTCNIDQYMQPFWKADTIYNELVLLSAVGKTANLMFTPSKIISVTNYDFSQKFQEGADYSISGKTITQLSSNVSSTVSIGVGQNNLKNVQNTSWTCVTYVPDRTNWGGGYIFQYKGDKLPKTMAKLKAKEPLVMIAFGMSITCGNNTSGFAGDDKNFQVVAPYMHSYVDMLGDALRKKFGSDVTVYNASCGGKTASWANQYVEYMVTPNNPDLVLLDQGMNDIWGGTATDFKSNIQSAISKIKSKCPNAEIILVNNILPGKGTGSPGPAGPTRMRAIRDQLATLESVGVTNFPMTQMSDSIYARKGEDQCLANALHPNDYLVRWYTQGLITMFDETAVGVNDVKIEENFLAISPNPVSHGELIIKLNDVQDNEAVLISILDAKGVIVAYFRQSTSSKDYDISSLSLSTGVYFVKAQKGSKVATQKLIVG